MEIKTGRLANGNVMAAECLGQLGHADEVTPDTSRGKNRYVCMRATYIHIATQRSHSQTQTQGYEPTHRSGLSAKGSNVGASDIASSRLGRSC